MTIVDRLSGVRGSLAYKAPVVAGTIASITLTGEQTIDGVAVVDGDRVLVKDQSTGADNGIYVVATGDWVRATDFNGTGDVTQGTQTFVAAGTINGTTPFRITTSNPITIGTTALTFTTASPGDAANISFTPAGDIVAITVQLAIEELDTEKLALAGGVMSGALDLNAVELILDLDGDTSITADTDDQIDIRIAGADDFAFKANDFDVLAGSRISVSGDGTAIDAAGSITFGVGADGAIYSDGTNLTIDAAAQIEFAIAGTEIGHWDAGGINLVTGDQFEINEAAVLSATVLGTGVVTSSLTTVGALASGSIASGFGTIATGNTIATTSSVTGASILANANDSGAIGASGTGFSDIFLADGAVINLGAGGVTGTHGAASDSLTFALDAGNALGSTTFTVAIDGSTVADLTSAGLQLGATGARVTQILDEDAMGSNSATSLVTQQSLVAYVAAQITAEDLDFQGDSGGALSIDLNSETLDIAGGSGIVTSGADNTLTVDMDINELSAATLAEGDFLPFWDITATATNKKSTWANIQAVIIATGVLAAGSIASGFGTISTGNTITTTALLTGSDLTLTADNPDIIGGDTDGILSITADTATNQGGNLKLYGNTHATKAQDIEFYADATLIGDWDESDDEWTFGGTKVIVSGTLEANAADLASLGLTGSVAEFNTALQSAAFGTFGAAQTDHAVVRADATAGLVQTSGVIIDDSDNVSGLGTLGVGAITSSGDLTFSQADPNIIGGDTNGILSITADTATNQGGNIKLYGNTHATLAQDIEFYADATLVGDWDESADEWTFGGTKVIVSGTLEANAADLAALGLTGSVAEFNTALQSASFATFGAAQADHAIVRADATAGLVQTSGITIDDSDNVAGMGTLGVGAITTTGGLTFSGANPDIIGGDDNGVLSITADTATNQGGNIKLYGNSHATLAQDIEFYADATLILSWDESEANWDFASQNVKGVGTLAASGTITGPSGTWDSGGFDAASGDSFAIDGTDVLTATTLGSAVVNSTLGNVGPVLAIPNTGATAGQLTLEEPSGDSIVTLTVPALAASYTLTLPVDDGTSGQIISTDGNGVLSWANNAAGAAVGDANEWTAIQSFVISDAGTDTIVRPAIVGHMSSGTPAAGLGVGLQFNVEVADGEDLPMAFIDAVATDVDAGTEDFDLVFSLATAGSGPAEVMRITSTGALSLDDPATTRTNLGVVTATVSVEGISELATTAEYLANTTNVRVLESNQVWDAMAEVQLTSTSNSVAWDMSLGIDFEIDLTENTTIANPTSTTVGKKGRFRIEQDAGGTNTVAWGTSFEFAGGTAPTATTTGDAEDIFYYDVISSTRIIISAVLDIS